MKRQAVVRSTDEWEQTNANESKRIKILKNETKTGGFHVDSMQAKSMDSLQNGSSPSHNHEDHLPVISDSTSQSHQMLGVNEQITPQVINGNESTKSSSEQDLVNNADQNVQSCDEVVVKVSSCESGIVSELYYTDSHENSVTNSDKTQLSGKSNPIPVFLNHEVNDVHNNESTDSFQSEGFEAMKSTSDLENKASISSHEQSKSQEIESNSKSHMMKGGDFESSSKSDVIKSSVDLDSLILSHLEVTELKGHSDVICSVAADEDFVLSASGDTTVKVWSTVNNGVICTFSGHSAAVTSLLLLSPKQSESLKKKLSVPDVSRIAITGALDCHIKLWSVFEGREISSVYTFNGINCLGYLESESYVVVGTEGGKLELWDIASSKVIQSVRAHEDCVSDIKVKDFNIYSVSVDGTVKVWLFEDEEIYPVYTRKRKELSADKTAFKPAHWKTVAVSDNVMHIGDSTSNLKVLDWRAGRLHLFKNQIESQGTCDCVVIEKDMLFTTYYDASTDTGGINVWKVPDMTYICTLTGEVQDISSLALVQIEKHLRIVTGGRQLFVWDFDFTKPLKKKSQDEFYVCELETLGSEIDESLVDSKLSDSSVKSSTSTANENNSNNRWCNVM